MKDRKPGRPGKGVGTCKRVTISMSGELYDRFRSVIPEKANVSDVLAGQAEMLCNFIESDPTHIMAAMKGDFTGKYQIAKRQEA